MSTHIYSSHYTCLYTRINIKDSENKMKKIFFLISNEQISMIHFIFFHKSACAACAILCVFCTCLAMCDWKILNWWQKRVSARQCGRGRSKYDKVKVKGWLNVRGIYMGFKIFDLEAVTYGILSDLKPLELQSTYKIAKSDTRKRSATMTNK